MKYVLKSEELLMFLLSIYLFYLLDFQWWWFPLLILTPDIGMAGYLFGNKAGALMYNFFHHKGLGILLYVAGMLWFMDTLALIGIIIFGHASLDRILGYGLKYPEGFQTTHLGTIGKN